MCIVNKSVEDDADIDSKVMQGRKVVNVIRKIVNTRGLSLEYAKLLHESMLVLQCRVLKCLLERKEEKKVESKSGAKECFGGNPLGEKNWQNNA